ncbi:unnamed protein product (macronuclear) [Paramecium tetraurelia]|uniref:Myb-like domain-containing protein n=1 Tax=Paramecium tetraurelia TaxID=5888 RepID=A0CEE2_PARTE|nr:uncharacterized protein GSPATT00037596001 [Paramecium tetraurelia]CAK69159.1 unnamed protein product [Paramecium tetraurelia]|eukprot:XP_001436556.1 hypothetical protein (macronuclear) [Paramecium tetraurelia strain d4-2]
MDRLNPSSKDCIVPLIEENSPCIQTNKPEIDPHFLLPQFTQMMQNPDFFLQTVQLEQLKQMQSSFYSQMNNIPLITEEPRVMDLFTQQLLQQQLILNAALLNQFQGVENINYSQTKDLVDNKIKRKHIKKSHNPSFNNGTVLYSIQGHWSAQEHQVYLTFLQQHKDVMESSELKKTNKIFKLMSDIIKSRSPSQCRSHHQKFNPYSKYLVNNNIVRRKMKEQMLGDAQQQKQSKLENDNIQQQSQDSNQKIEFQQQDSNQKLESQQQLLESNVRDDQQQLSGQE